MPACLSDYHKHMKGVDLLDQMIGNDRFVYPSKKWWRRLFFFLLAVRCLTSLQGVLEEKHSEASARVAANSVWKTWHRSLVRQWQQGVLITPTVPEGATCEKLSQKGRIWRECIDASVTVDSAMVADSVIWQAHPSTYSLTTVPLCVFYAATDFFF